MSKATKVVHLTSVHGALDARVFYKECKTLAAADYDVTVIAPQGGDATQQGHGIRNGVRIRGVPKPRTRLERMTRTVWQLYREACAENASICHLHDPELIPVGLLLRLRGKRVIYDVHEDLPKQILDKDWIPKSLRRWAAGGARLAEAVAAWAFHGIVAATPAIARRFPAHKTALVQNFAIPNELLPLNPTPYRARPAKVIYVGGMTATRGIREMVRAIGLVPASLSARLVLVGTFSPPSLEDEVRSLAGWERVEFAGWQDRRGVAELLGQARAGLVVLYPTPKYLEAWPIKLFEYMSAGLPVIASNFPLLREIIEEAKCGLLVDPLDPAAIAQAIQWLLEHPEEAEAMGRRGQEAVKYRYNWDAESRKLLALYERLS